MANQNKAHWVTSDFVYKYSDGLNYGLEKTFSPAHREDIALD